MKQGDHDYLLGFKFTKTELIFDLGQKDPFFKDSYLFFLQVKYLKLIVSLNPPKSSSGMMRSALGWSVLWTLVT